MHSAHRLARGLVGLALITAVVTADLPVAADALEWSRPVDGAVVVSFREPISRFGAGHRGVDFAAQPGTPVRAANDGEVTYAGDVAGALHVVVLHDGGIRTSYSFVSRVDVRRGQRVAKGQVVGASGGATDGHAADVFHFGARVGERYVDPMLLFQPPDLTEIVHLAPTSREQGVESVVEERRALLFAFDETSGDDSCASGIPFLEQACDAFEEAFEAGVELAKEIPELADALAHGLEETLRVAFEGLKAAFLQGIRLARDQLTAIQRTVMAIVDAGRHFLESLGACDENSPPANGKGGSGNAVVAVGGIDSSRDRGDRRSFDLPAKKLGFDRDETYWFSYATSGSTYTKDDTHQDLRLSAQRLAEQLKRAAREQPGRKFDLLGHSQGGVVIDVFLFELYMGHEEEFPPIDNVVTFASPHEGAPLATLGDELQRTAIGSLLVGSTALARDELGLSFPPPDATSVLQLSEDSSVIKGIQDERVPDGIHFTSISGTDDPVVFSDHTDLDGAATIRLDVGGLDSHSAITSSPRALMAARASLEHRELPCTTYAEKAKGAFQSALASVIVAYVPKPL